ncbi:MFS transporter [Clostridium sp. BJN0001]|uniref:MFS transporter n=1 Tax=Clostridium sp. BJN0001 TaxID=2930219 RepID=UPI001FD02F76|nr:MFS transporter [Clostridium sp. BJN0001]
MKIKNNYNYTVYACFIGYITQAIVNNFLPLLFVTLNKQYNIPLDKITFIIALNFSIQLIIDLFSAVFIDKIGYRASVIIAHIFSSLGLILLAILPNALENPYIGIVISASLYAVGGGIIEVMISPIVEACPTNDKSAKMSLLHSFYCWGQAGVILFSTLFFAFFGLNNWAILSVLWAMIPIFNTILFFKVPIKALNEENESMPVKHLMRNKLFYILIILMICAGACEQAVSQWASYFAEKGLNVNKNIGDLLGPCFFALLMGSSRLLYSKKSSKVSLKKFMILSGILCIISYLMISLSTNSVIGLLGCGLCGLSVGILWPGTFSMSAERIKGGGTFMFALLAFGGDVGCSSGPFVVGIVTQMFSGDIKKGIFSALIFPVVLIFSLLFIKRSKE